MGILFKDKKRKLERLLTNPSTERIKGDFSGVKFSIEEIKEINKILKEKENPLILKGIKLENSKLPYIYLYSANLRDANLWGVDLRNANLSYANLRNANLRDAILWNANLWGVDLRDADLENAKLRDADLENAILWNANLWGVDLSYAKLRNADLWGVDLSYANLRNVDLWDARNLSHTGEGLKTIIKNFKMEIHGPAGSRGDYTIYFPEKDTVFCGGRKVSLNEFEKVVEETYSERNKFGKEYKDIISQMKTAN